MNSKKLWKQTFILGCKDKRRNMTRNEYKIMRILIGLKVALTLFLVFCHPATVGCSPWTAHERLIGEISSRR